VAVSRGLLAVCGLTLCGATVAATVIVPTDFKQVVALSTVIVRGHVTDTRGIVAPSGRIETVVTVAVDNVLKGHASGFVSIRLPGGEVGRTKMVMVGAPTLKVGQHAVLFLKAGPDNALRPVALTMGVYPVQPDPRSGRPAVAPPAVQGQTTSGRGIVRGDVRRAMMPVPEFESLVKMVIGAPKAVPRTAVVRGRGQQP
jgi:hypothetical protein